MIVLEGCDKTGKSTLAKMLGEALGWPVVSFGVPKTANPYHEYLDFLTNLESDVVLDRFHAGEFVYPWVFNRTTNMTLRHFRTLDLMLRTLGTLVVHCSTHDKNFLRDKFESEEDMNSVSKIDLTQDLFQTFFHHASMFRGKCFKYDIRLNNQSVFVDLVVSVAKKKMTFLDRKWLLDTGFQGHTEEPRVLFVGEVVNEAGKKRQFARPFDLNPSSDVLFNAIEEVGVHAFAIINTATPDGTPVNLKRVVNLVKPKMILALGDKAHVHLGIDLDWTDVPLRKIQHPGYTKRFMNIRTTQAEFNQELERALEGPC